MRKQKVNPVAGTEKNIANAGKMNTVKDDRFGDSPFRRAFSENNGQPVGTRRKSEFMEIHRKADEIFWEGTRSTRKTEIF